MSSTRQLLPRDARRAQILRAAAATFALEGYAATSVDDVAKTAGITKLIVYRHFESKADLYREILEETSERLVYEWVAKTDSGHEQGAAIATLLAVARELPDGFRLLFVHASRESDFEEFALDFRALQVAAADRLLERLLLQGPIRAWLTQLTIDILVASVLRWMEVGDPAADEEWSKLATDGVRTMIAAAVGSSPDAIAAAVSSPAVEPQLQAVPAHR